MGKDILNSTNQELTLDQRLINLYHSEDIQIPNIKENLINKNPPGSIEVLIGHEKLNLTIRENNSNCVSYSALILGEFGKLTEQYFGITLEYRPPFDSPIIDKRYRLDLCSRKNLDYQGFLE